MPTYRVTKCDPVTGVTDAREVGIAVEHGNKFKYFQGTVMMPSASTERDVIQAAWTVMEPEIRAWISSVDSGEYCVGSIFVPQADGTIIFMP